MRLAPPGAPLHIHAAEQTREVDDCYAWSRMRPIEWLLTQANIDARWCIVHATHMTEREVAGLAQSGAVAGLAPTTEADLGDGTFPGEAYLAAGGRFGVGSDSNTIIDPFAELRQLEWSQRTAPAPAQRARRRGADTPVGAALWARCRARRRAGARPQRPARIAAGSRADLVVLDGDDPALAEQPSDTCSTPRSSAPAARPVRDVMSGGAGSCATAVMRASEAAVAVARYRRR